MKNSKKSLSRNMFTNKESYIEYHFLHSSNTYTYETRIPASKIQKVFIELSSRFGENNHSINEYSQYSHENLELTIYMDSSNFCKKVKSILVNDPYIKDKKICSLYVEKNKVHNDSFPSLYNNTVYDIIDIVFELEPGIFLIIRNKKGNTIKKEVSVEKIGVSRNSKTNNTTWSEIYLQVSCESNVEKVHSELDYICSFLQ
jgi:hypothetical protein